MRDQSTARAENQVVGRVTALVSCKRNGDAGNERRDVDGEQSTVFEALAEESSRALSGPARVVAAQLEGRGQLPECLEKTSSHDWVPLQK